MTKIILDYGEVLSVVYPIEEIKGRWVVFSDVTRVNKNGDEKVFRNYVAEASSEVEAKAIVSKLEN